MKAYVICCNNIPEAVVIENKMKAVNAKNRLEIEAFNKIEIKDIDRYRMLCSWSIKEVNIIS